MRAVLTPHDTFGRVAEWSIASVLKTDDGQPSVSSNLTSSAKFLKKRKALNENSGLFLLAFLKNKNVNLS